MVMTMHWNIFLVAQNLGLDGERALVRHPHIAPYSEAHILSFSCGQMLSKL